MHAGQTSKFYQKVLKSFINKVRQDPVIAAQLESHNIQMNQLESKIKQKMKEPKQMFNRVISGQNQIEKEQRQKRQIERASDIPSSPVQTQKIKEQVVEDDSGLSYSNDLEYITQRGAEAELMHQQNIQSIARQMKEQQRDKSAHRMSRSEDRASAIVELQKKQEFSEKQQEERSHKRPASDYLPDDFSDIEHEEEGDFKRFRQDSKIHILGTYQTLSKRHKFSQEKTQVMLENVFIKVEGLNKELFLKKVHYTSQKRLSS